MIGRKLGHSWGAASSSTLCWGASLVSSFGPHNKGRRISEPEQHFKRAGECQHPLIKNKQHHGKWL